MDAKQLFIPDKIKVGFQNRSDTYTKKLAYVIYYDQKGVLRKEKSWQSWRDDKIDPNDFENKPVDGFVLNKGVGGQRQSYGWNARNEYIRVYDPRDFEFEISVSNLLFILRECDCNKGKGLEGKFVYAWDGTELVLLPEISQDYQNSKNFTDLQTQSVKAKDLIPGATYQTKKQETLVYIGRLDYHYIYCPGAANYEKKLKDDKGVVKRHVFWNGNNFEYFDGLKHLATCTSEQIADNFAELADQYYKSPHGSKIVNLFIKNKKSPKKHDNSYYYRDDLWVVPGVKSDEYIECFSNYPYSGGTDKNKVSYVTTQHTICIEDGVTVCRNYYFHCYRPGEAPVERTNAYWGRQHQQETKPWIEPTTQRLWAALESGAEFALKGGDLIEKKKKVEVTNGEEDDD